MKNLKHLLPGSVVEWVLLVGLVLILIHYIRWLLST